MSTTHRAPAAKAVAERLIRTEVQVEMVTNTVKDWQKEFRDHAARMDSRLHTLELAYQRLLGTWRGMSVVVGTVAAVVSLAANLLVKYFA